MKKKKIIHSNTSKMQKGRIRGTEINRRIVKTGSFAIKSLATGRISEFELEAARKALKRIGNFKSKTEQTSNPKIGSPAKPQGRGQYCSRKNMLLVRTNCCASLFFVFLRLTNLRAHVRRLDEFYAINGA